MNNIRRRRAAWRSQCKTMAKVDTFLTTLVCLWWVFVFSTSTVNWDRVGELRLEIVAAFAGAGVVLWVCLRISKNVDVSVRELYLQRRKEQVARAERKVII